MNRSRSPLIQQARRDLEETDNVAVVPAPSNQVEERRLRASLNVLVSHLFYEPANIRKVTTSQGAVLITVRRSAAWRLDEFEATFLGTDQQPVTEQR